MKRRIVCLLAVASLWGILSCRSTSPSGSSAKQQVVKTDYGRSSGEVSPQGPAAAVIKDYLVAAGKLDPSATMKFLSREYHDDVVAEFQANAKYGWTLSGPQEGVAIAGEEIDTGTGRATVKATVIFKGGDPPAFMANDRTFFLVLEDGAWKVSGMAPAPRRTGPGMRPLSR